jgi:cytidylate kinase
LQINKAVKKPEHIIITIDGPSASGKSTNARLVAKNLGYIYVDTGAMYRTLAWYCLQKGVDVDDHKAVSAVCKRWKPTLELVDQAAYLLVDGYFPKNEIRTSEVSAAVAHVAAIPKVREWMKKTQQSCSQFGNLVMEGRDTGTNIFPETDFKFYLDACIHERSKRREAEGVQENLAARDAKDSQRATSPLMIPLGAKIINNSGQTPTETSGLIIAEVQKRLADRKKK